MKPLQHAQISAKKYGGCWQDYIELHSFLDSSKAACAHFKHRFLLHHAEGIEIAVLIFGETIVNSDGQIISTKSLLTDHLIEDVGKIVSIEDWANDLFPTSNESVYKFLAKKRNQIESDFVKGETELLRALNLSEADISAIKDFLKFPLKNSDHPAAILFSHNSFAIFLAEKIFGYALEKQSKAANSQKPQLISTREVFERLIFWRMKAIYSPAEIIARSGQAEWMRGGDGK
jgi:hypothetical protein